MKHYFLAAALVSLVIISCGEKKTDGSDSVNKPSVPVVSADTSAPKTAAGGLQVEAKTFPVPATDAHAAGWGYDLYVGGKRTIHQDIIPAVQGNQPFATEEDARKTGALAAKKMMETGDFPTISVDELKTLGIIK